MTSPPQATLQAPGSPLSGLLPLLTRLDQLLERAIAATDQAVGDAATPDAHRGLHITDAEAERLLTREPGVPAFLGYGYEPVEFPPELLPPDSRFAWLQQNFGLSNFDLDVVAIALAPELDRRYERLYAYVQDDVRCRRPTIDLALNLLCVDAMSKLAYRSRFAPAAPLIKHQLLHLESDAQYPPPTCLSQSLRLDEQVVRFLLHQPGLAEPLASICQLLPPEARSQQQASLQELADDLVHSLLENTVAAWHQQDPLCLYLEGRDRPGKRRLAMTLAAEMSVPLLVVEGDRLLTSKAEVPTLLKRLFREAWFQQALLYFDGIDDFFSIEQSLGYQSLLECLTTTRQVTLLSGTVPWKPQANSPLGIVTIPFPMPDFELRRVYWQQSLQASHLPWNEAELDRLSNHFRLTAAQIQAAVLSAQTTAQVTGKAVDLFAAARAQAGHELRSLARKIDPHYSWHDIVLPPMQRAQLQELCNQSRYQHRVYEQWGFGQKLSLGKGLNALFSGLPGTGKTMAAEVIAKELQRDLYKIDLSQVVSKYIGETEKNLDRIFTAATDSNAILLFDEADALFGKRSEVRDAHDRYANIEVAYLLQKMEEYEGIAILTTNARSSIDEAFVRRLQLIIEFPLPTAVERYSIWQNVLPKQLPRHPDLDIHTLAETYELTGANIHNVALAAAFFAATAEEPLDMKHLKQAICREHQKMGKLMLEWH